jgi:UDP-N-acetylmuramate dehydrogenase
MDLSHIRIPAVRGRLVEREPLAPYTWFRVGGPADLLFLPKDEDDLASFLAGLPLSVPVTVLGAASNMIVRDGGVDGVVIKLTPAFGRIAVSGTEITAGAAALDMRVADAAAEAGLAGLEFFSGVPGTVGGALLMNAGCYGDETKDILVRARALTRSGERIDLDAGDFGFAYRHSAAGEGLIFTEAVFRGRPDDPPAIRQRMDALKAKREASQPIREKTGGSTFANPDPPGSPAQRRAWELIDSAGLRGARRGGAAVSDKHCNFLINADNASAADIEDLGEDIRAKVRDRTGIDLRWEIKRIGRRN